MQDPKVPSKNDIKKIIGFLDDQLRPDGQWSISEEYPLVFEEANLQNIRFIEEDDKIISHAVLKTLLIKSPVGIYKVAAIGSVVTHPEHRHQGLSRKLIESCLESARLQGCDMAILWTDIFDFYRRMGFELAGTEVGVVLEGTIASPTQNARYLESSRIDPKAILNLYDKHSVGTHRTPQHVQRFLSIPNSRVFTSWDAQQKLQAYAVVGKGMDLSNYIHEWGGGVSHLLPLLSHIQTQVEDTLTIIVPEHSQNLLRQLQKFPVTLNKGYLGMIKIVDHRHLIFKSQRFARVQGIHNMVFERTDEGFLLGVGTDVALVRSETELTRILFGPERLSQQPQRFQPQTLEILERILPLPLWIWGWDSV